MTAPALRSPALPAAPAAARTLVARCAAPALWADSSGEALAWNEAAEPLARALAAAAETPLRAALARVAATGQPVVERFGAPPEPPVPERSYDLSLIPLEGGALAIGRETTLETHLQGALVASRKLFKDLVACSTDFAWETDADGRFTFVSPAGALGYSAAALSGRKAEELLAASPSARGPLPFSARAAMKDVELWLQRADGGTACMLVSCLPAFDAAGRWIGARGVCRDVTELRAAQVRLLELARTDELTGLPNRRAFEEEAERRLGHLRRMGRWGALLFFDLDNFKAVNDARGHAAGDAALREFARLLTQNGRAGDIAARLGGDEFALWLEETDVAGALAKAEMLLASFRPLLALSASEHAPLTASIGVAVAQPDYAGSIGDLIAAADQAMYRAKREGKGRIALACAEGES